MTANQAAAATRPLLIYYLPGGEDPKAWRPKIEGYEKYEIRVVYNMFQLIRTTRTEQRQVMLIYDGRGQPANRAGFSLIDATANITNLRGLQVLTDPSERVELESILRNSLGTGKVQVLDDINSPIETTSLEERVKRSVDSKTAVVVMRDTYVRDKALRTLDQMGFQTHHTQSVGEGLCYITVFRPDLVLAETPYSRGMLRRINRIPGSSKIVTYVNNAAGNDCPKDSAPHNIVARWIKNQQKTDIETCGASHSFARPFSSTVFRRFLADSFSSNPRATAPPQKDAQGYTPHIFIMQGPSAVGKTTTTDRLKEFLGDTAAKVLKHTSRPRNSDEIDGKDMVFLTRSRILENQAKGAYLCVYPFKGYLYAIDRTLEREFREGKDVLMVMHVDDLNLISGIEARYRGSIVYVTMFAPEEVLIERMKRRPCSNRERKKRVKNNRKELMRIMGLEGKVGSHYTIRTCAVRMPQQPETPTSGTVEETVRRLYNIVNWERHHPQENLIDALTTALTGLMPHGLDSRIETGQPAGISFDKNLIQILVNERKIDESRGLEYASSTSVIGTGRSWGAYSMYISCPDDPARAAEIKELIRKRLEPYLQPKDDSDIDPPSAEDPSRINLARLDNARYMGILSYSLNDDIYDVRGGRISLEQLAAKAGEPPKTLNICLVAPTPGKRFSQEAYTPERIIELFGQPAEAKARHPHKQASVLLYDGRAQGSNEGSRR